MKRIIFLYLPIMLLLSCSKDKNTTNTTVLTGSWQLVESSADMIDPYVFYHLIFENGEIFSLHNVYNQPVVDCKSKKYSINNNSLSFKHHEMEYSFKFELTGKNDTLLLTNTNNWYKFFKIKEMVNYKSLITESGNYNFGKIENDEINEASGIVASRKNPRIIWTHNDRGGKDRIFGINYHGEHIIEIWLDNCEFFDPEDIAIINIDGEDFILLGDIGDNKAKRDEIYLYLIPEMKIDPNASNQSLTLTNINKITLQYPDGKRDSEALTVLPNNKIMVISKRDQANRFYTGEIDLNKSKTTLEYQFELPITKTVGADMLDNGDYFIFKTYDNVYSMLFDEDRELPNVLTLKALPYEVEPQGEAICWDLEGNGYFTLSEERNGFEGNLFYYPFVPFWMR